jgi:hypothetical protein
VVAAAAWLLLRGLLRDTWRPSSHLLLLVRHAGCGSGGLAALNAVACYQTGHVRAARWACGLSVLCRVRADQQIKLPANPRSRRTDCGREWRCRC